MKFMVSWPEMKEFLFRAGYWNVSFLSLADGWNTVCSACSVCSMRTRIVDAKSFPAVVFSFSCN